MIKVVFVTTKKPRLTITTDPDLKTALEQKALDEGFKSCASYAYWVLSGVVLPDRDNPKPKLGRPKKVRSVLQKVRSMVSPTIKTGDTPVLLQQFLDRIDEEIKNEEDAAKKADEKAAIEGRQELEGYIAKHFPKFWDAMAGAITGCVVVRLEEPVGGSGDGALALVVDDLFLLYPYRNSAYNQITVTPYLKGEKIPQEAKKYSGQVYSPPVYPRSFDNDRALAKIIKAFLGDRAEQGASIDEI